MIGIVLTGHGEFASGLATAIELIAGRHENFEAVDFPVHYTNADLAADLDAAFTRLSATCSEIIFCTDIAGGAPFNHCLVLASTHDNCHLVSGTNVPVLLEALFSRTNETAENLTRILENSQLSRIQVFQKNTKA